MTWNDKFNKDLQRYIDGEIGDAFIYKLGMPSEILKSTGFPDREMQMAASRLAEKARDPKHPYNLREIKGFVDALNDPIAVFKYKNINEGRNIIIQFIHEGKRFLAGVHIDKEKDETSVTDIRNLFPKDTVKWLNWIQQGKSMYLNKNEVQAIIAEQRTNHAEVSYVDLDFVAKIVEKFENPKLLDEKIQNTNEIFEEFDDNETTYLKEAAKQAIRDRITNSWQRFFTSDQVNALNRYHQVVTPDIPAHQEFRYLLDEVAQEPDVARKPDKWVNDTARELDGLAEGITRESGQGLKR